MSEVYDAIPDNLMQKIRIMSECDDVRDVPGFPGYAVTLSGQVWSVRPRGTKRDFDTIPRRIKSKVWKGVETINLTLMDKTYTFSIGRLLLLSFVAPPPFEGAHASFKDGNSNNIRLDNLEWLSTSETHKRGVQRNGGAYAYGEALNHSVYTAADVAEMRRRRAAGATIKQLMAQFGGTRRTVERAVRGDNWKQVE